MRRACIVTGKHCTRRYVITIRYSALCSRHSDHVRPARRRSTSRPAETQTNGFIFFFLSMKFSIPRPYRLYDVLSSRSTIYGFRLSKNQMVVSYGLRSIVQCAIVRLSCSYIVFVGRSRQDARSMHRPQIVVDQGREPSG